VKKDQSRPAEGRINSKSTSGRKPDALRDAQVALLACLKRYTDLYDFAPVGYFTFDRRGLTTEANLTGASLLGVERGELTGKPFSLFVAAPSQDTFHRHYRSVLKTGTAATCELQLTRKDGASFYASVQSVPVRDAEGNLTGVGSAIGDITESKRIEEALHESEERFQQVAEHVGDFIWEVDANGLYRYTSPSIEKILGYRPDELIGKMRFYDLFAPEIREELKTAAFKKFAEKQSFRAFPNLNLSKDGRVVHLETSGSPVLDTAGNLAGYRGVDSDVTERQKLEVQLRQSQKMEAMGTLAGGIAHDFNNILMAIIGFTEMVLEDVSDNEPVQRHMEQVLKAGFRGRDLVRQILTFSRRGEQEKTGLHLSPLIQETFKLLRSSIPTTIEMKLDLDANRDFVYADPSQIQQIIMNLCTNAFHAMREKGGTLEVSLRAIIFGTGEVLPEPDMVPGEYLVLSVRDTGHGMEDSVLKRIFEPFFTTKEKGQGTGLGLSVVYGIAKSHSGGIRVSSRPGQGSLFSVYLPAAPTPVEVQSETVSWDTLPAGTERILFVDDEESVVELGQGVLRRLGYTVVAKRSGRDALETFREDRAFDLVITDQTMPEMTGVMLAAELLKLKPDLPVILFTGYSESVSRETAQEVGISEFLMKPLSKRELAGAVRRALEGKK